MGQTDKHENGIATYTHKSWKEFVDEVEKLPTDMGLFRGQSTDWPLKPKLLRLIQKYPDANHAELKSKHLQRFKLSIRGRCLLESYKSEEDYLWALGQHYGLATPLLDWTTSPFIALFFAFESEVVEQEEYRYVYLLLQDTIESAVQYDFLREEESNASEKKEYSPGSYLEGTKAAQSVPISFIEPLSGDNPRLMAQRAISVKWEWGLSLEDMISRTFKGKNERALVTIRIPSKGRDRCLRYLDHMNINRYALFPDLHGAADYCNYALHYEKAGF